MAGVPFPPGIVPLGKPGAPVLLESPPPSSWPCQAVQWGSLGSAHPSELWCPVFMSVQLSGTFLLLHVLWRLPQSSSPHTGYRQESKSPAAFQGPLASVPHCPLGTVLIRSVWRLNTQR